MKEINSKLLKKFVQLAVERLSGDWIIIGGTVLPLVNIDVRLTLDIDVAKGKSESPDQTLQLMEIAEDLGLPVEAINQAGSFFLRKIENWEDNLVLIKSSKSCRVFRPDSTLFLLMKIARFSENDFMDCREITKNLKRIGDKVDSPRVLKKIDTEIENEATDLARKKRLTEFQKFFEKSIK